MLALMVPLAAVRLSAEVLDLPVERPLVDKASVREISVELRHASIEIVVDPEAEPRIRARRRPAAPGTDPQRRSSAEPAIRWGDREGVIEITRVDGEGQIEIPIRLELVVHAAGKIWLRGSDLEVTVRQVLPAEAAPALEQQPPGEGAAAGVDEAPPLLELEVERSDVYLEGIRGARLTATGGALVLERTRGELSLAATAAVVEIKSHVGDLRLRGNDSEFHLADHRGDLSLELQASRLVVRGGEGRLQGRTDGGRVELEGWRGRGQIEGDHAVVEVRQSGAPEASLALEGRGLEVLVDQYEGAFTALLDGGGLRGGGVVGKVDITGRSRAVVRLVELDGEVRLNLASGATARLTDVAGKLVAEVEDSRLEVARVENLNLLATGAEIFVTELFRLGRLKATDSRLELDLTAISHNPTIILKGSSVAQVRLPLPCEVRVVEAGESIAERAEVTGCELRTRSHASQRFSASPLVEGAVKLVASVPEASSLTVQGVPIL